MEDSGETHGNVPALIRDLEQAQAKETRKEILKTFYIPSFAPLERTESKVRDFQRPALVSRMFSGLINIPVNQGFRMGMFQPVAELDRQVQAHFQISASPLRNPVAQIAPVQILNNEHRHGLDRMHVVAVSYVRMQPQVGPGLGLASRIKRATRCLLQVSPASRRSRKTRGAP